MIRLNGFEIERKLFPNNELKLEIPTHIHCVSLQDESLVLDIEMNYHTDEDIFVLMLLKKYLDDIYPNKKASLTMKYIPYSRMDRAIGDCLFTLKYFCKLINDLDFSKVYVLDAHSNVSLALIERCVQISMSQYISQILNNTKIDHIFYPDLGASSKYSEVLRLNTGVKNTPCFHGYKKRNTQTGEITKYQLMDCPDITDKNILIVDDLCSKGGTCYYASLELKKMGADKIYMYVSHCENSIHLGKLLKTKDLIENVFTTDSILTDWSSEKFINVEYY